MTAIAKLGAISLDASDPAALAAFYRDLLELEVMVESDSFIALQGAGVILTVQKVDGHQAPTWPADGVPKQIHLELGVTELDASEAAAIALGAAKPADQPTPESWRVLIDPAGHPFCLTTLLPGV